MTQTVELSNLGRADGSASYSSNGYTVIAAVNGPIEVQRRDELPEEAAVDVVVRPAIGVGVLPALLQASIFALLSSSIPLTKALTSTLIAVSPGGNFIAHASALSIREASSVHVFAFSSLGELLLNESEGIFSITLWEEIFDEAKLICRGSEVDNMDVDVSMGQSKGSNLEASLKQIMEGKIVTDQEWKGALG
ncbi:MAG: hypothetical protein LQ351_007195 [Letrouitia transgressa]|nr:MAG: hypothetical protein LQ351_007195 [Letrouitia transgressa]